MNSTKQTEKWIADQDCRRIGCALRLVFALALFASTLTQAQTYSVLYTFQGGTDGSGPRAALFRDAAGNLYGTTFAGDTLNDGTVFRVGITGKEKLLHSFDGSDGSAPWSSLIRDSSGNFYGTTYNGGISGFGEVFKLDSKGNLTRLYCFTGGADGANPRASLVRDTAGNLYGTTFMGGAFNAGTVFKVDPTGAESVLYSFKNGTDGGYPWAGLIRDSAGNLYGTAVSGGASNLGVVFKVSSAGTETVLHSFAGGADGMFPASGNLLRDSAGNLYGVTPQGGTPGYGVLYKVNKTGIESVLYTFSGQSNDGGTPVNGLVRDSSGNLYGTVNYSPGTNGGSGYGGIFELTPAGQLTLLYRFGGQADGAPTYSTLIRDSAGNLYGTAYTSNPGQGVVFKLAP